jgi:hypothetical protein
MRLPSLPLPAIGWRRVWDDGAGLERYFVSGGNAPMLKVEALQVDGLRRLKSAD